MIELQDACERIRRQIVCNGPERRTIEAVLDCVLAEDVVSSSDSPPYDKAMVDGYAVIAADLGEGTDRLKVVEDIHAGHPPQRPIQPGHASRIMTGAILPLNADAVVMVEQTRRSNDAASWVEIAAKEVRSGQNIMRQGAAMRAGDVVLPTGHVLRPIEIGLLAEAGRAEVDVIRPPRVAIIQTGDELVGADEALGPGQIRNSNGPMLSALIRDAGAFGVDDLGIVRDQRDDLDAAIERGLAADVLVLSGGVSAGDRDLVPQALTDAGVRCEFHKVKLRPGKPLWFGTRHIGAKRTLVFGLPGNPVSSLVCCRLLVTPTLRILSGHQKDLTWHSRHVPLAESFSLTGSRATFWPGKLDTNGQCVRPLDWLGSADPFSLARSDCLIHFPDGHGQYTPNDVVSVIDLYG